MSEVGSLLSPKQKAVYTVAEELLRRHHLWDKGWRFRIDQAKRRAGNCNYTRKQISVSRGYIQAVPEAEILDTLLHEIAHALVGHQHSHDAVWKSKARDLGCSAERCHQQTFSEAPFLKKCVNGCWAVPVFRRNRRIQQYRCRYCSGKVEYRLNQSA